MSGEPLRSVLRADEPATLIESGRIAASLFDEPVAAQHSNNEARFYLLANGTIVALPYADPPLAWADAANDRWQSIVNGSLRLAPQPDPKTECAIFGNSDLDTEGGWDDMLERGPLEELLQYPLDDRFDWANIVDLASGDTLFWKNRSTFRGSMKDAKWLRPGEVHPTIWPTPDDPTVERFELTQGEAAKLRMLGGAAWLAARLAEAPEPAHLPLAASGAALLRAIEHRTMPVPVRGSATVHQVEELRKQGMVQAQVHLASAPEGDYAVVLAITAKGQKSLTT